jgi:YD repeat-containing protein
LHHPKDLSAGLQHFPSQSYQTQLFSHATLVRTSSSPIRYERRLRDGVVEVFAQADGASTFPRRVFMTEWRNATGNKLTFTYDGSLRLVAVTDAIGQVTTLTYGLASDPLKITQVPRIEPRQPYTWPNSIMMKVRGLVME